MKILQKGGLIKKSKIDTKPSLILPISGKGLTKSQIKEINDNRPKIEGKAKIKKAQNGNIVKFFDGQVENAETIDLKEYLAAKDAYLKGKKLEGNKVYDNWDKYNYARQYFETNPKAKSATIGTTYDKYGNRWDDQIIDTLTPISKKGNQKSKLLEPTGEIANYFDKTRPLTGSQIVELNLDKKRKGGIIEDNRGQWAHPGKVTKINSNNITMKGVDYPVLGVSNKGDKKLMMPNKDYKFKGDSVTEYPIMQQGGNTFNMGNFAQIAGQVSNGVQALNQGDSEYEGPSGTQQIVSKFGPWGAAIGAASQLGTSFTDKSDNKAAYTAGKLIFDPGATLFNKDLSASDRIKGALNPIYGAKKMFEIKQNKKKQQDTLKDLNEQVLDLPQERIKRNYVRPEDNLLEPNNLNPSFGTGSNFLAKNGKSIKKADLLEKYTAPTAMKMGGELQTHWGGKAKTISQNPYLPDNGETVLFEGNSHNQSDGKGRQGIGITYGNSPVEVETGEPAVKTKDNNLTVFGNMQIPSYGVSELNDPKAKGKKFKTYIKDLSEQEMKQNKISNESVEKLNTFEVNTPIDKLTFNSAKNMLTGSNMNLKDIAEKKKMTSIIQNAILETAEENNLDSDQLAKGKFKKAKKSTKTAQRGTSVPYIGAEEVSLQELEQLKKHGYSPFKNEPNLFHNENLTYKEPFLKEAAKTEKLANPDDYWNNVLIPKLKAGHSPEQLISKKWMGNSPENLQKANQYFVNSTVDRAMVYPSMDREINLSPKGTPNFSYKSNYTPNPSLPEEKQKSNIPWMDMFNSALPYLRPSNRLPLDPTQLAGEMYALSNNQIEPVQAQKYSPLLEQATDISLQDQLNANQSDFNSIKRLVGNNPAALSAIAAQKYAANSGVLGEQFRINQNQKLSTYNKNREILNDATLKNLEILDQQYTRQSQAKSNTKAVAQSALSSIADKIAKNKLENRTLGIYENLYNYRYLPNGQAVNLNPLQQFNMQGNNLPILDEEGNEITIEQTVDKDGRGVPTKYRTKRKEKQTNKKNGGLVKLSKNY